MIFVTVENEVDRWQAEVRSLLKRRIPPDQVVWRDPWSDPGLFHGDAAAGAEPPQGSGVSTRLTSRDGDGERAAAARKKLIALAEWVICHRDPGRWDALYRVAWRMFVERDFDLLDDAADPDVRRLEVLRKQTRFDAHKAKAFVRFRNVADPDGRERYLAWHRPAHRILGRVAPFFARRFGVMDWTIMTPDESAIWDGRTLRLGPGVESDPFAGEDSVEDLWKTYYASIFNPARVKVGAMLKEMPRRYWQTMPEASIIDDLLREAGPRVRAMIEQSADNAGGAEAYLPPRGHRSLPQLAAAARHCQGCELFECATQTVFGEGPADARLMLVGEQPGDEEDRAGRPFVGPAGRLLDEALREAGIERGTLYVTNAVKHFRHEERGKRRIHKRPTTGQARACQPWLRSEIEHVSPRVIAALGVTAARTLLGPTVTLRETRGRAVRSPMFDADVLVTTHPSAILRMTDEGLRREEFGRFVRELSLAYELSC